MENKKRCIRPLCLVLVIITLLSTMVLPAAAISLKSTSTVTGCIGNSYGSAIDVYTNGKSAKLRICTFNQAGDRTSGKITVKAVADNGAVYVWRVTGCNGPSGNTTNITLPSGNTHYKVYICRNGTSNKNLTRTYYFSVDFKKNCWH